ncbi:hypothetical protein SBV1_3480005 [Verrucomicrobia bacterium]|nr:hypothetical protein SBV1_3480005 [Verrucomicrobiota bacterium]
MLQWESGAGLTLADLLNGSMEPNSRRLFPLFDWREFERMFSAPVPISAAVAHVARWTL